MDEWVDLVRIVKQIPKRGLEKILIFLIGIRGKGVNFKPQKFPEEKNSHNLSSLQGHDYSPNPVMSRSQS